MLGLKLNKYELLPQVPNTSYFHPFEVVSRDSVKQLQVGGNFLSLFQRRKG